MMCTSLRASLSTPAGAAANAAVFADFHEPCVEVDDRVDAVQRPGAPRGDVFEDRVGDPALPRRRRRPSLIGSSPHADGRRGAPRHAERELAVDEVFGSETTPRHAP